MTIQECISLVDDALKMMKDEWVNAPVDRKAAIMKRVDAALDKRLELMKQRDGLQGPQPNP